MLNVTTNPVMTNPMTAHVISNQPDVLQQILNPGINLSLWQRTIQPSVLREISCLRATELPDVRCSTSLDSFDDDVYRLLQQQSLDPLAFSLWREDLSKLADLYFRVSGNRNAMMRLETTADDGCRRFHVDRTRLRLLCTYRGPGTEWLSNEQVDRLALSTGSTNDHALRFGAPSGFSPFWVGILKGKVYPGNSKHGLVHRSPSIAGTGQTRVVFCLDC